MLGEKVGTVRLTSASNQLVVSNFCFRGDNAHVKTLNSYIPLASPNIVPEMTELSKYVLKSFNNKDIVLDFETPEFLHRKKVSGGSDAWEIEHHLYNSELVKGSTNPKYTISIYHEKLDQKLSPQPMLSYLLIRQ